MTHTEVRVVLVTVPDDRAAQELSRSLVEGGFAACVNRIASVRSTYAWEGEIHDDPEVLLVIKTTAGRLQSLTAHVLQHHPHDCPEVIAMPVVGGSATYLDWVGAAVGESADGGGDAPTG